MPNNKLSVLFIFSENPIHQSLKDATDHSYIKISVR